MANQRRLKRRLINEAVHDNVLLIRGVRHERRRRSTSRLARIGSLTLLPAAVVVSTFALASVRRPDAEPLPTLTQELLQTLQRKESAEAAAAARYDAPQAIDPRIFPLGVQRIILDPGHGGANSGTVTSSGLMEKDLALDIALRLRDLLVESGLDVVMTRQEDRSVTLEERVDFANRSDGDLFVSIHLNWISTRSVRGIETYYLGPSDDPYITRLASSENRESGYSLADFRHLLEGIYADIREDESHELADAVQAAVFRSLRKVNPRLRNRGVKTAPFVVLIGTRMPAILAEVSCLSNEEEAELLTRTRYRQYIAEALAAGIESYADTRNQIAEKGHRP